MKTNTQPTPGSAFAGGIYAGIMRGASVVLPAYHLIVATGHLADRRLTWGPNKKIKGADCEFDGLANTKAIIASGLDCPAAQTCVDTDIDGNADWYLPSRRELSLCYANAPELFKDAWYWSSTQSSDDGAWSQHFYYGLQNCLGKSYEGRVRLVRRVPIKELA